jgi:hypothetical protein
LSHLDAVRFVSDFITYTPLDVVHRLPETMRSPASTLTLQEGNSFELSTLLASLLIGMGYDAYCISGYASRAQTYADLSATSYPEMAKYSERSIDVDPSGVPTQRVRSKIPNQKTYDDLYVSQYDQRMSKRGLATDQSQLDKVSTQALVDKDNLQGFRVHSWVLCLPNRIFTGAPVFIESSTGQLFATNDANYHGVESVWNNTNYWINMQDCTWGTKDMSFALGDPACWENVFQGPNGVFDGITTVSWVQDINSLQVDFSRQFPNYQKSLFYNKILVKKFANFSKKTGCVVRLLEFEDAEMTRLKNRVFEFDNRVDRLVMRRVDPARNQITDFYDQSERRFGLVAHRYGRSSKPNKSDRVMVFASSMRADKLRRREERSNQIEEFFDNNDDMLAYRRVVFAETSPSESKIKFLKVEKRTSRFAKNKNKIREIVEIFYDDERFRRTPSRGDEAREVVYNLTTSTITVNFCQEAHLIASSSLSFVKPIRLKHNASGFDKLYWDSNLYKCFEADPSRKAKTRTELESIFAKYMQREKDVVRAVRRSELEKRELLRQLRRDAAANQLENLDCLTSRLSKLDLNESDATPGYLLPYVDASDQNTVEVISKAKTRCLLDCQNTFKKRIGLLQVRYDREACLLDERRRWFTLNKYNLVGDQEKQIEYVIAQHEFNVDLLAKRIRRVCLQAKRQYDKLDTKVRDEHQPRPADRVDDRNSNR